MILSFTEKQIDAIKLWAKFMIIWCIAYTFCHFFVWNPIKVEEMSELQHHKDVYVYDREKYRKGFSYYSWMKLAVNHQVYQCECATYHCYGENYGEDKNRIEEISFFIINKKYCVVVETVNQNTVNITKRISYSDTLENKGITKENIQFWHPKYLYSDYHNSYKEIFSVYLVLVISCSVIYLYQPFFWVALLGCLVYSFF